VAVNFINPSLYFVNAPLDTKNHEEKHGNQVRESLLNPKKTPKKTNMQKQTKTKTLTKETIRKIIEGLDNCDAHCLDEMERLDFSEYYECMSNCVTEIGKKLNVSIDVIFEIERTLAIDPYLFRTILG
jgi:hypothetical protein